MISVNNVGVYFGGQTLFDDVSFMINQGDRIGLVGKNGAGKSTLLRLISGEDVPNSGQVDKAKEVTIGYLTQDLDFDDTRTVIEEAESVFKEIKRIEHELEEIKTHLEETTDHASKNYLDMLDRLHDLENRFVHLDGNNYKQEIGKVLVGLGFDKKDFDKQTSTFSGGWRMRIELAKILLQKPDVILLDEPTNHLDIESIMWLEKWLRGYSGAVVLVSHDRTFLDTVCNRTIEIMGGKINDYKASYSKFMVLREERIIKQQQAKKNQDKYIEQTKELINKFRAKKNKAAFAQSLIKKLDKLEIIEVESVESSAMRLKFPPAPSSGKITLVAEHINKSYGEKEVLKDINLELVKQDRIAFVGKNGEGKTTFAKIIADNLQHEGKIELGHNVKVGYYAQNQSDLLEDDITVLKTIENAATQESSSSVRKLLGSFLFSGDAVEKKVKVLSGGERARLALCKLLLEPVNLLVMDEPTNHLDMQSKDILKSAMLAFDGTLIIVSHDRDFLQNLTKKVYEFKNHNIKEYIGDINSFLKERNLSDFNELEDLQLKNSNKVEAKSTSNKKVSYKQNKQLQKKIRMHQNRSKKLENEITELENKLKGFDEQLADPLKFKELSAQNGFFEVYEKDQNRLKALETEWEKVQTELEAVRNDTNS